MKLKKTISLVIPLLLLIFANSNAQQKPQLVFNQANQQLEEGNIRQALAMYHSLEEQNQLSGALFLNMGLSYMRVDSMGKAKYYFLKTHRFPETKTRADQALKYVESRFSRQSAVLPTLPWQRALNWMAEYIGATILLACGVILFNIGIFLYIIPWFASRNFSHLSTAAITTAVTGLLIVALSFYIDYREQRYHKAVMIATKAQVTDQPSPTASMVSQAFEGYTFTIDKGRSTQHEGWSYIRMSNGQYGWIPTKEIMIL